MGNCHVVVTFQVMWSFFSFQQAILKLFAFAALFEFCSFLGSKSDQPFGKPYLLSCRPMLNLFKGYHCYKTILCHKAVLDVQLMNFFIWRKSNVSFSRYQDFCVFVKPADFKICDEIISIAA